MKFGVVGTNFVSTFFMKAGQDVSDFEVVAVTSGHKENAIKFAQDYNIKNVYDSLEEMIESMTVDAIYLATPNKLHKPMALTCLKHHIPCFVEKPFGCNYQEVSEMITYARNTGTYIHDAIIPLYTQNFSILKEEVKRLGKIRKVNFTFNQYSSRYDAYLRKENPTTFRKDLYNGSIMDIGIYPISVIVALFGKPNKIYATAFLLDSGVDACGTIVLSYDGFDAVINHSKVNNSCLSSEIAGELGCIQIDSLSRLSNITKTTYPEPRVGHTETISVKDIDEFAYQIQDFIDSNKQNLLESPKVPASLSLLIHEVITECRMQMGLLFDIDKKSD